MILSRLRRSLDASKFNEIANHPDVRPWLGGQGPLDVAPIVLSTSNVSLLSDGGGFICHNIGDGRYEVHSLFLPDARGEGAIEAMREGLRYLFCATDCVEIVTKCPDGNRAALGLARAAGFQEIFRREHAWIGEDGLAGVSYQSISFDRWLSRDPEVERKGAWFHDKLERAKHETGSDRVIHEDEACHDRAVGAAVLMVLSGNPRKAVWSYNRWAVFAGYAPISLLSETPIVVDVVDAIVAPTPEGDMEVLLCR